MPKSSSFTVPGSRDEDVRRLEVAVHDEGAMRVLHGVADPRNRRRRASSGRCSAAHHSVIGNPVDELHHEIRRTVGREAAVEQPAMLG